MCKGHGVVVVGGGVVGSVGGLVMSEGDGVHMQQQERCEDDTLDCCGWVNVVL